MGMVLIIIASLCIIYYWIKQVEEDAERRERRQKWENMQ